MYRNGRHFAVRLTHLPVELVKEVLDQLVRNDAEAACVALTNYCSASRRTQRVCGDDVWSSAYEALFDIEPVGNPKAEFRAVCSFLSRLDDDFRVDFMKNNKSWNELELNRAWARIVALQGEGALTDLLQQESCALSASTQKSFQSRGRERNGHQDLANCVA